MGNKMVIFLLDVSIKASMIIFFYLLISAVLGPFRS